MTSTFKSFMDYRAVTDTASKQYKLLNSEFAWTREDGMRMIGDREAWALGLQYGDIGSKFNITLSSGQIIKIIKGDAKAVMCTHPDSSMLEAIVDEDIVRAQNMWLTNEGLNITYKGSVVKIEEIIND